MSAERPRLRIDQASPAARLARAVAAVAHAYPDLGRPGPPRLESEPCEHLAGPWESAAWTVADRGVRLTCFPGGSIVSLRDGVVSVAGEYLAGDPAPRVLAAVAWLTEG